MATIHFIMGSKGGTGKSMSAALLAAYLQNFKKLPVFCYDTDPQNATLKGYKAFNVKLIKLIDPSTQTINTRFFDTLIEDELFQLAPDAHGIVDVGSGSYTGLKAYLLQNTALPLLQNLAKSDVYFHTVLTGGQAAGLGQAQSDAGRNITGSFPGDDSQTGRIDHGGVPRGAFLVGSPIAFDITSVGGAEFTTLGIVGGATIEFDASRSWGSEHTANEFRPQNRAVRYLIRALP